MSDITIDNLSVVFPDGTTGLEGIDLRINSGEFVALVGPSGSGKTTLLRTLAGFVDPSSGAVSLDGVDVSRTAPEKRHMGMVFQQHAVWPHMSVEASVKRNKRSALKRPCEWLGWKGLEQDVPLRYLEDSASVSHLPVP